MSAYPKNRYATQPMCFDMPWRHFSHPAPALAPNEKTQTEIFGRSREQRADNPTPASPPALGQAGCRGEGKTHRTDRLAAPHLVTFSDRV